jgi:hypothetical protein
MIPKSSISLILLLIGVLHFSSAVLRVYQPKSIKFGDGENEAVHSLGNFGKIPYGKDMVSHYTSDVESWRELFTLPKIKMVVNITNMMISSVSNPRIVNIKTERVSL